MEGAEADHEASLAEFKDQLDIVNKFLSSNPDNEEAIALRQTLLEGIFQLEEHFQMEHVEDQVVHEDFDFEYGDSVLVSGGDRPFAATFIKFADSNSENAVVRYFEYDSEATVPVALISKLPSGSYNKDNIVAGLKCLCKYSADQQYYEADVIECTKFGVLVLYSKYGNKEEVPAEYLIPKDSDSNLGSNDSSKKTIIAIPEKLKILPTDTEEEKMRKKKKIKAIKSQNRLVSKEIEFDQSKQQWKKFQEKSVKKSLSGVNKSSIFSSTDDVNGKVGVVNSGKKLTPFVQRQKHLFSPN